jgi:hypothetical protein
VSEFARRSPALAALFGALLLTALWSVEAIVRGVWVGVTEERNYAAGYYLAAAVFWIGLLCWLVWLMRKVVQAGRRRPAPRKSPSGPWRGATAAVLVANVPALGWLWNDWLVLLESGVAVGLLVLAWLLRKPEPARSSRSTLPGRR